MFAFYVLTLLVYSTLVRAAGDSAPLNVDNIFILAGQSNMSGRGGVTNETWDGVVPLESERNPSILRLNAELTWVVAEEPLHKDIDVNGGCGIGPGMSFANSVLVRDSSLYHVGLVPCAVGGTKISQWARGTDLYNRLLRRAAAASSGSGGVIRGLLWYQGESDTIVEEDAELYEDRLKSFFTDVRSDLGLPTLPIIQVALASGQGPYKDIVRKAQLEIELPNVRCVDANGLQLQPDYVHLSTPAQVKLGQILADAYLQSYTVPLGGLHN